MPFTSDELSFINRMAAKMADGSTFDEAAIAVRDEVANTVRKVQELRTNERKALFDAFSADVYCSIKRKDAYRRAFG